MARPKKDAERGKPTGSALIRFYEGDSDMVEFLDSFSNRQDYIKSLVLRDMYTKHDWHVLVDYEGSSGWNDDVTVRMEDDYENVSLVELRRKIFEDFEPEIEDNETDPEYTYYMDFSYAYVSCYLEGYELYEFNIDPSGGISPAEEYRDRPQRARDLKGKLEYFAKDSLEKYADSLLAGESEKAGLNKQGAVEHALSKMQPLLKDWRYQGLLSEAEVNAIAEIAALRMYQDHADDEVGKAFLAAD